ncbi:mucin-5AC-like [Lolium rigidum]|uniref:mucin-5AC-like n=1 Tax=Lolium rigidum TaxID=89674 RepID=UPI001F5C84C4|nr:mucin-5AC-like [Lolium rigidum]
MQRVAMAEGGAGAGRTLGAVIREKDEELALFLQMRRRRGQEADLLLDGDAAGDDDGLLLLDPPPPPPPHTEPRAPAPAPAGYRMGGGFRRAPGGADDFLHSDAGDKNDYDWLLTPPGTPLFPSHEAAPKRSPVSQTGSPKTRQAALKSRLANHADPPPRATLPLRTASSNSLNSAATIRRPSSSGGLTSNSSRPSTPTGRAALTATSKGSRPSTPNSRATLPGKTGPTAPRSSTPTSRSTLPAARSTQPPARSAQLPARSTQPPARSTQPPARSTTPSRTSGSACATRTSVPAGRASAPASRSSTPTSRSSMPATRSTTPLSRPSLPAQSKPASRSSTPTRRSSAPAPATQHSNLPSPVRSSSISRPGPTMPKTSASAATTTAPPPSRGSSPTVRSRPWKPSEMPGFSLDAPPNLRTSLPERPTSVTRGRPGAPSSRSSSVEPGPAGRPKRQSCSPSRGRTSNGSVPSGSSMPAVRRSHLNGGDSVNPVQMGNKMVERVVNMRRLVPPKHDDQRSSLNSLSGKSLNSPDSSGFGRSLSKKSLDMALRHMDIRRSIPNNLRPLMTSIPASSVHSARSGSTRGRPLSVSDSPLATSSNASSEPSVNNNLMCFDSIDIDDELCSSDRAGHYAR